MSVKFGIQIPSFTYPNHPNENVYAVAQRIAKTAEDSGYDSVWLMDHLYQIVSVAPEGDPILECWTTLAALAAVTKRVKLGTMVTAAGFRPPSVLAKMTATIDTISNGRLICGIGAGWCDYEHKGYGLYFPAVGERMKRLEEAINVLKAMWTQDRATYIGQHFRVENAVCFPKPVQKPHIPILIGGSGEKVTLRLTAQYAQAHNIGGGLPEANAKVLENLKRHCEALGANYDAILKTRLTPIMFAANKAELERKIKRWKPAGISDEHFTARTLVGTPNEVAEKLRGYVKVGINYFIVSFWDVDEFEPIKTLTRDVLPQLS